METTVYRLESFQKIRSSIERHKKRIEIYGSIFQLLKEVWPGLIFLQSSDDLIKTLEPLQMYARLESHGVIISDGTAHNDHSVYLPYDKDFVAADYEQKLLQLLRQGKIKESRDRVECASHNAIILEKIKKTYSLSTPIKIEADHNGIILTLSDHTKQVDIGKLMIHINRSSPDTIVNYRSTFQLLPGAFMFTTREYKFEEYWGADSDMLKIFKGLITHDTDYITSLIHTVTSLKHLAYTMIDEHIKSTTVTEDL